MTNTRWAIAAARNEALDRLDYNLHVLARTPTDADNFQIRDAIHSLI